MRALVVVAMVLAGVSLPSVVTSSAVARPACPETEVSQPPDSKASGDSAGGYFIVEAETSTPSPDAPECPKEGTPGPSYLVEEACPESMVSQSACISQRCDPGETSMVRFPIVNGVADRSDPSGFCAGPADPFTVRSGQVLREIRRIGLPASKLSVQPPGGRTLVNFDTIFSTTAERVERTITVAGIRVGVRIWPSAYAWHWGDESDPMTSEEPGRPYEAGLPMDSYITHQYVDADVTVEPRVDVTFAAEFRVRNGAWQPVDGTVTIEGLPASLRIVEARPVLTGSD
jgi:hypothetical protein